LALSAHVAHDHDAANSEQPEPHIRKCAQRYTREDDKVRISIDNVIQQIAPCGAFSGEARHLPIDSIEKAVDQHEDKRCKQRQRITP